MTVEEIIDELDDHGFEDTTQTRKLGVINDTVWDVCSREPWPFLEASTSLTLGSGDNTPTLPSDFRAALTIVIPTKSVVLQPERLDTIVKNYPAALAQTGVPAWYYFVGDELRLLPVPDAEYTATLFYLKNQAELSGASAETDILIPPRHHRVIVLGALYRLYAMEDDPDLSVIFRAQYEDRIKSMAHDVWKKQFDRPDRVVDVWADYPDW